MSAYLIRSIFYLAVAYAAPATAALVEIVDPFQETGRPAGAWPQTHLASPATLLPHPRSFIFHSGSESPARDNQLGGTNFLPVMAGGTMEAISALELLDQEVLLQLRYSPTQAGRSSEKEAQTPELWAMLLLGAGLVSYQLRRKLRIGAIRISTTGFEK